MCLKCRIDLGIKTMEKGKKLHFMALFRDLYRYNLSLYRYNFVTGHFWPSSTGTI